MYLTSPESVRNFKLLNISVDYGLDRLLKKTSIANNDVVAEFSISNDLLSSNFNQPLPIESFNRPPTQKFNKASSNLLVFDHKKQSSKDPISTDSSNLIHAKQSNQSINTSSIDESKTNSFKYYENRAREILNDPNLKNQFLNSPEFKDILKKQQSCISFDLNLSKIVSNELKSNEFVDSGFILEIVTLALSELDQNNHFQNRINKQKHDTKYELEENMKSLLLYEDNRRERLEKFADKIIQSKQRISAIKETKNRIIEEKKELLKLKKERSEAIKNSKTNLRSDSPCTDLDSKIRLVQQKRNEIDLSYKKQIEDSHHIKNKKFEEASYRLEMYNKQQLEHRAVKSAQAQRFTDTGMENDRSFRTKSKEMYDKKDQIFMNTINQVNKSRQDNLKKLSDMESIKNFQANQKRRLLQEAKNQSLELSKIKFEKIATTSEIKDSISSQRNYMTYKILTNKLGLPNQTKEKQNIAESSPGPGDYDPKLPRTITGGVIGTAGSYPSSILSNNSSPGPGTYNLSTPVKSTGTGVIPFMGRGKTNTDILISNSKLLPGPGYYDISDYKFRGGKIASARVPGSIESVLRVKSSMPGPGYYDLEDNKRPKSLHAISYTNDVSLFEHEFPSLFETLS